MRPSGRHRVPVRPRRALTLVSVGLLAVTVTGCGKNTTGNTFDGSAAVNVTVDSIGGRPAPDSGGVPKTTTSSGGARNGAAVPAGVADTPAARGAFCTSLVGVDAALASSAPANDAPALRALADRVRPLVDTLRRNAPTPVAGAVQTVADALAQVSRSGDAGALSTPPFRLAAGVLGTWAHENCGFQQVDVIADDGGFRGLAPRLRSGITSFRVRNAGQQDHVMVVARKKPGVRAAPLDILRSGVDDAMAQVDIVSAVYAAKGEQSEATAVLTAGSYFVFCDVAAPDGRPHYLDGEIATFVVR